MNGIQEVGGSTPPGSTSLRPPSGGSGWQAVRDRGIASREKTGAEAARRSPKGEGGRRMRMTYVYLLESVSFPEQRYVGHTDDLRARLKAHNAGQSPHTAKFRPWRLVTYIAFSDETKAVAFEQYLKTGSGRAFANKRFR